MSLSIPHTKINFIWLSQLTKMVFVMGLVLLVSWPVLSFYFRPFFHVYLSIIVLPLVLRVDFKSQSTNRLLYVGIFFIALFIVLKIHLLFFTGFCFLVLSLIEKFLGKINHLPIVLVLLMSPFTIYFLEIIGYPLRIQLANMAAQILSFVFDDIQNKGNIIELNGFEILVDKACAGLRMITTGLISALAFCGIYERQTHKSLSIVSITFLLIASFIIIVFANLIRIILLILFESPPETLSHEMIGLLTYAAIILPLLMALSYVWVSLFAKTKSPKKSNSTRSYIYSNTLLLIVLSLLMYIRFNYDDFKNQYYDESFSSIKIEGFKSEVFQNGVLKLNSENALIYLKPPQPFYSADHTPVICWRGSGYTFKSEEVTPINNHFKVNTACLVNEGDQLYTAWYYDNKVSKTHSPFIWRWRQLNNEPSFRLINITSDTKENLICELLKLQDYDL